MLIVHLRDITMMRYTIELLIDVQMLIIYLQYITTIQLFSYGIEDFQMPIINL